MEHEKLDPFSRRAISEEPSDEEVSGVVKDFYEEALALIREAKTKNIKNIKKFENSILALNKKSLDSQFHEVPILISELREKIRKVSEKK